MIGNLLERVAGGAQLLDELARLGGVLDGSTEAGAAGLSGGEPGAGAGAEPSLLYPTGRGEQRHSILAAVRGQLEALLDDDERPALLIAALHHVGPDPHAVTEAVEPGNDQRAHGVPGEVR